MTIQSTVLSTFGYHGANTIPGEPLADAEPRNAFNIMGYFPIVGLFPCVYRLTQPHCDIIFSMKDLPENVQIAYRIRGILEGLGIGSIYIIPDLLVTIHRFAFPSESRREVSSLIYPPVYNPAATKKED